MSVTMPIANNQYATLVVLLAQQAPDKVLESIPGIGVGSKAAQDVASVWENGLPRTGNPTVDTLVVNRVNDTVSATKKSVSQVKEYSRKGLLIGALIGLKVQASITLNKVYKQYKLAHIETVPWQAALKTAVKTLRPRVAIPSLITLMGVFGLIGLGTGLGIAVLKSIGRAKQLIWGQSN